MNALQSIYKYRKILKTTLFKDVHERYAGSVLGAVWSFLTPLILLSAYTLVYIFIFRVKVEGLTSLEYVLFVFAGLVPYLSLSDSLANGVPSVLTNIHLVRNLVMPLEMIPVKAVLMSQIPALTGFVLITFSYLVLGKLTILFFSFILLWILHLMFCIGVCWILSPLHVYFKDIQHIIPFTVLVLMMLSPISYSISRIPENFRPYFELNPLYHIVICFQQVMVFNEVPPMRNLIVFIVMSFALFCFGYKFISKMKMVLSDYAG